MARCLYCFEELQPSDTTLHFKCTRRIFSTLTPPTLPYSSAQISEHSGSDLSIDKSDNTLRFVDGDGGYSLSTGSDQDDSIAPLVATIMRMAEITRVAVVPHTLISSTDGRLHHITRSVKNGKKGANITTLQISELIDSQDNATSYEIVAEVLKQHSTTSKLDIINLYERVLFCYLVGDSQLDLASFKIAKNGCGSSLAPACAITPHSLISPNNEMAMTLNNKRGEFSRNDFEVAMLAGGLEKKIIDNMFTKFEKSVDLWCDIIDQSPMSEQLKESYKFQIIIRLDTL